MATDYRDVGGEYIKNVQNQDYLDIGGQQITKDWRYSYNPAAGYSGAGTADYLIFNPNDPTQRIGVSGKSNQEIQNVQAFLQGQSGDGKVDWEGLQQYYPDVWGSMSGGTPWSRAAIVGGLFGDATVTGTSGNPVHEGQFAVQPSSGMQKTTQTTPQLTQQAQQAPIDYSGLISGGYLKQGIYNNSSVKTLQGILNDLGSNLATDGDFGPLTKQAVIDFQKKANISPDGIVGPQTIEALNKFANQATNIQGGSSATTAGGVSPTGNIQLPTSQSGVVDYSSAIAYTNGINTQNELELNQISQQHQATLDTLKEIVAKTETGKAENSFLSSVLGAKTPDTTEELKSALQSLSGYTIDEFGMKKRAINTEIETLSTKAAEVQAAAEAQILAEEGRLATTNFTSRRQNLIRDKANIELNKYSAQIQAKTATLAAMNGDLNQALNFAQLAVQAQTAEQQLNLTKYQLLQDINKDLFDTLSQPFKDAYNLKLKAMEVQLEQDLGANGRKMDMMLEAAQYGVDLSGAMNGSEEDMAKAFAQQVGPAASAQFNTRYSDSGGTLLDRDDILDYRFWISEGTMTESEAIEELKLIYPNLSESQIRSELGLKDPNAPNQTYIPQSVLSSYQGGSTESSNMSLYSTSSQNQTSTKTQLSPYQQLQQSSSGTSLAENEIVNSLANFFKF